MTARNTELIQYVLTKAPGTGRAAIAKILYVADLEARRYLGRPLSTFQYALSDQGPFDPAILLALDTLDREGIVDTARNGWLGCVAQSYRNVAEPELKSFAADERIILNHVGNLVQRRRFRDLIDDIVRQTKPMTEALDRNAHGEALRMELVDNELRIPGLDLDRVLQAIKDLDAGKGRRLSEIIASKQPVG